MNIKRQIPQLLETEEATIRGYSVAKLGLFGSVARGEDDENSDIDLLVEFLPGQKNYDNFID